MSKKYTIEGNCQYDDCPVKAEIGWSGRLYCWFHYSIVRKARSNRLKKQHQENRESQGVLSL